MSVIEKLKRLREHGVECSGCGLVHRELFALVVESPMGWPSGLEKYQNHEDGKFVLSDDVCVMNGHDFFVRCSLKIPILDSPGDELNLGVWCSLSPDNFEIFCSTFDDTTRNHLGPWFGWFSNSLPGFPETLKLKCHVWPQDNLQRPIVEIEPTDHPLSLAYHNGICLERAFEIYALCGHVF